MPYPFSLPTTSQLSFTPSLSSPTHPSLPLAATTYRGVLRNTLKRHKRLAPAAQTSGLSHVLSSLNDYIPYLFALDCGLSGTPVETEEVDVILAHEIEIEWRATLSSATGSIPGRLIEKPRVHLRSLEYELFFVLSTLAMTCSLLARRQLHLLYTGGTENPDSVLQSASPSPEARLNAITTATKYLLQANSIYNYLVDRAGQIPTTPPAADISVPTLSALSSLTMAEATLLAVLKDDPYPAVVAQDRNKHDKEWMIKAPDLPKVRAHLFARLCLAAAEHASRAQALLQSGGKKPKTGTGTDTGAGTTSGGGVSTTKIDENLIKYLEDLSRTARAKACRFFGIDADLSGRTGEAIGWLRAGKKELGSGGPGGAGSDAFAMGGEGGRSRGSGSGSGSGGGGLGRLKKSIFEKREDKKIEKGADWGRDAGRIEEGRVNDMLDKKWVKMNDTINTQLVPAPATLLAQMPSGRDIHSPRVYTPPHLDEHVLSRLRAPFGDSTLQPDPASASGVLRGDSRSGSYPGGTDTGYSTGTGTGQAQVQGVGNILAQQGQDMSSSDDDDDDGPGEGAGAGAGAGVGAGTGQGDQSGRDRNTGLGRTRSDGYDAPPVGAFPGTTRGDYVGTGTGTGSGSGNMYY